MSDRRSRDSFQLQAPRSCLSGILAISLPREKEPILLRGSIEILRSVSFFFKAMTFDRLCVQQNTFLHFVLACVSLRPGGNREELVGDGRFSRFRSRRLTNRSHAICIVGRSRILSLCPIGKPARN